MSRLPRITGSDAVNAPLSRERAEAVRDYLSTRGLSPSRVSVTGRGSHEPVAGNDRPGRLPSAVRLPAGLDRSRCAVSSSSAASSLVGASEWIDATASSKLRRLGKPEPSPSASHPLGTVIGTDGPLGLTHSRDSSFRRQEPAANPGRRACGGTRSSERRSRGGIDLVALPVVASIA